MTLLTPEQMLYDNHTLCDDGLDMVIEYDKAVSICKIYAQQEAIAFVKWIFENAYDIESNDFNKLYNLYLKSKK